MRLVGRANQLTELEKAAEAGRGGYVALIGEPGIGKTRLAEEAGAQVADRFDVAWGRCFEVGGTPALWPWIEVSRTLGIEDPSVNATEQFEVFDRLARSLQQAAAKKPLLIVLDDMHAADRSSLLMLQFAVRQVRRWRSVVLATYRDVEARLRADATDVLAKASREGNIVPLARLGHDDVAALAADAGCADVADRVFAKTEGNPLFVGELLRYVDQRGADAIPDGVRAVIAERIQLLSAPAREALAAGAVIGREFEGIVVGAVLGIEVAETRVRFVDAVRAGLIAETAPNRYRFDHVRIRDVLYDELPPARAAEYHRAAATMLTRIGGDAAAIAAHWCAVGPSAARETIEASQRAAAEATRRKAFDEAADQLARASDVAPHAALAVGDRISLALDAAAAAIRAGRTEEGLRACEAARDAREANHADLVARAALGHGQVYRFGRSDPTMVALLREALAGLPERDSALRAQLLGRLAGALQPANDLRVGVRAGREAIAMARRLDDPQALLSVLMSGGAAYHPVVHNILGGVIAVRLGRLDEARARVAAMELDSMVSWGSQANGATCVGDLIAAVGTDEQRRAVYDALGPMAEAGRIGVWGMTAMTCLGPVARAAALLARSLGREAEADRFHALAVATATRVDHVPMLQRLRRDHGEVGSKPAIVLPPADVETAILMQREGDSWLLKWQAEQVRVRDSRGLHMIAELVSRPGDDVHVRDLASGGGAIDTGDSGEQLDRTAIERYRTRMVDLTSELEDAEDSNDIGRAEHLREELEMLPRCRAPLVWAAVRGAPAVRASERAPTCSAGSRARSYRSRSSHP